MKKREIKFRYILKNNAGDIFIEYYTIEELEEMEFEDNHTIKNPFIEIVARNLSTGLTDKEGIEVYEGDIVENQDEIVYEIQSWFENADALSAIQNGIIVIEVIGNIYENKGLLT